MAQYGNSKWVLTVCGVQAKKLDNAHCQTLIVCTVGVYWV